MSAKRTWVQGRCPACGHGRTKMQGAAGNRAPLCSVPLSLLGHGGDAKQGCLPISGHHPDSCLSCQPLDHIHPPELSGPSRAAIGSARVAGEGA